MSEPASKSSTLLSDQSNTSKLNSLRAAVLGANDGVVSVSSIVMGVAGAGGDSRAISLAGLAALIAGALSMAVGEYVSVSSQSDAEKMQVKRGERESDAEIVSPWHAAIASLLAFTVGGLVPFLGILLVPENLRINATIIAVIITLVAIGLLSAYAGKASRVRAVVRVVTGGVLAMVITYLVGVLFGTAIA